MHLADGECTAVYDLGGGTFDCAVVRATSGTFEVVGRPGGDPDVGGELFDEMVLGALGRRLPPDVWAALQGAQDLGWRQAWVALRNEARRAKELLSTQAAVDVRVAMPTGTSTVRITRAEVEEMVEPALERTIDILERTIAGAGLRSEALHSISLVGGASRMPIVQRLLAEAFPALPISRRGDPKAVVALGATHPALDARHGPLPAPTVAVAAPPVPPETTPPAPRARRRRLWVATAAVAAAVIGVGAYGMFVMASDDPDDAATSTTARQPTTTEHPTEASDAATTLAAGGVALPPDPDAPRREIAFASSDRKDLELYAIAADGSGMRQLTVNSVRDQYPAWSPDGSRIAWTQESDVLTMSAEATNTVNLTADVDDAAEKPAWSPDGSTIVFVRTVDGHRELWAMSAVDGSGKRPLVTFAMEGLESYDPAVGPDGTVFYSAAVDVNLPDRADVWVTDLEGTARRPLDPVNGEGMVNEVVDVSADGTQITFSRYEVGGQYDVFVAAADGTGARNVTATAIGGPAASDGPSSWAPDGRRLAIVSTIDGGDHDIWILDLATGEERLLLDNDVDDLDPDWRPLP